VKTTVLDLLTGHGPGDPRACARDGGGARLRRDRTALMAMLSRARRRPGPVLVESVLVVVTYALAAWLLARAGA
jgi:hypothetical protein